MELIEYTYKLGWLFGLIALIIASSYRAENKVLKGRLHRKKQF
jgi:hypothetical protein